jgi:hypothetical protein
MSHCPVSIYTFEFCLVSFGSITILRVAVRTNVPVAMTIRGCGAIATRSVHLTAMIVRYAVHAHLAAVGSSFNGVTIIDCCFYNRSQLSWYLFVSDQVSFASHHSSCVLVPSGEGFDIFLAAFSRFCSGQGSHRNSVSVSKRYFEIGF